MRTDVETLVVGSGFAGLCAAIRLRQAGRGPVLVLEKAERIGGTWRDNTYPGCACDVPSHLYSFSFAPNPGWSRMYAPQAEILDYLERCADTFGVRPHVRFGWEVAGARFDERDGTWTVRASDGRELRSRYLVLGLGALSRPAWPEIAGLERFRGRTFHSAAWDHGYNLDGKRVAVIGSGASAVQFVPQIAPRVARLHLFQRTPPWVLPKPDRAMSRAEQRWFATRPIVQRLYRHGIYWLMDLTGVGFTLDPGLMRAVAWLGERHIRRQIRNPQLRAAVTPSYVPGCKRILLSNDYYPALDQPHVEVVTEPIAEITDTGVVTRDGALREVDAILLGTGFRVTDLLTPMQVIGLKGVDLSEAWRDGAEAYRGTTVSGFPNLFVLTGPNTGLGNNSMVFMMEAQMEYVLRAMAAADRRHARWVDVAPVAQSAYNRRVQSRLGKSVWATGCKSWYLDRNGRNSTLWPGFSFEFWLAMRLLRTSDHIFHQAPDPNRVVTHAAPMPVEGP